jgi:hypothetical protein
LKNTEKAFKAKYWRFDEEEKLSVGNDVNRYPLKEKTLWQMKISKSSQEEEEKIDERRWRICEAKEMK